MLICSSSTKNAPPHGDKLPVLLAGVLVHGEVARKIMLFVILEAVLVEHSKAAGVGLVARLEYWVHLHLDIVSAAAVHSQTSVVQMKTTK